MSEDRLQVSVQPFARAREACGVSSVAIDLPADASVADCLESLCDRFPGLRPMRGRLLVAVNERYARLHDRLANGDVVALIPPVSGG